MTRSSWGLALLDDPRAFMAQAVCGPESADWFFLHQGMGLSRANQAAPDLCDGCPVLTQCWDHAATHPEPYSRIAGGRVWKVKRGKR